jgi:glycosyltransferase involved in cell wall biosynthesis
MIKIFDCSLNSFAPSHRPNSLGPKENDIMFDLKKYSSLYGFEYVENYKKSDVIITNTNYPEYILNTSIPKVKRMDGIYWDTRISERNIKLNEAAINSDLVIFISEFSKKSFHTLYPELKLNKESVVLNNVADSNFYKINNCEKPFDFVASCTNWEREEKRFKSILQFAEFLKTKNKTLLLIGSNMIDVPYNVFCTGYIRDYQTLNETINLGKYFVNFSYRDSGCKCVSQAIKCGLPVLYANSGGVPELVNENCVPINDIEEIYFDNKVPDLNIYNMIEGYETIINKEIKNVKIESYQTTIKNYFDNIKNIL